MIDSFNNSWRGRLLALTAAGIVLTLLPVAIVVKTLAYWGKEVWDDA